MTSPGSTNALRIRSFTSVALLPRTHGLSLVIRKQKMDPGSAGHATEGLYFFKKKCQGHEQWGEAEELFLSDASEATGWLKTTHTAR